MQEIFMAKNSKKQVLIFVFIALVCFMISVVLLFIEMQSKTFAITVLSVIGVLFVGVSLHLFFQPEIAIKASDKEIIFYKRNNTFKYSLDDIVKVQVNVSSGSFDTYIYTKCRRRKGFHFLIINSNKKKDKYIRYFKSIGIKVVTYHD